MPFDTRQPLSIQSARTINVGRGSGGGVPVGGTLTISGTGFGERTTLFDHYDNYNDYADGTTATEIGYLGNGGQVSIVSNESHEGSGKSLERFYAEGGDYFPRNHLLVEPSDEIYLAFWAKWDREVNTEPVGIFKLPRGGSLPNYTGAPRFYETVRSNNDGIITTRDGGIFTDSFSVNNNGPKLFHRGDWHFCEYYFRLSTPGIADGEFCAWTNGTKTIELLDRVTRLGSQSEKKIEYFINFFDGLDQTGNDTFLWQSEEYASGSRARVVITDNADYDLSTKFQIQPIQSWSDSEIVAVREVGSFASGQSAFAHVFNSLGAIVGSQQITV